MSTLAELLNRCARAAVICERPAGDLEVVAELRTIVRNDERRLPQIEASNDPRRPSGRRKLPPSR